MKFSTIILLVITGGVIFYILRNKNVARQFSSTNTSIDANKKVDILNPQASNGEIVQVKGGSYTLVKTANGLRAVGDSGVLQGSQDIPFGTRFYTPFDTTSLDQVTSYQNGIDTTPSRFLGGYTTKQDGVVPSDTTLRGDVLTARDIINAQKDNVVGTMYDDVLPDPSLALENNFAYLNSDGSVPMAVAYLGTSVPLSARQDSPLPQVSIVRTNAIADGYTLPDRGISN